MQSNRREENPPNHEVEKEDKETFIGSPTMNIMMYSRSIYTSLYSVLEWSKTLKMK